MHGKSVGSRQKKLHFLFITLLSTVSKGAVRGGLGVRLRMSNLKAVVLYCVVASYPGSFLWRKEPGYEATAWVDERCP